MSESSQDTGLLAVLLERLEKQRLPRALDLKTKVDQGDLLDERDLRFLHEMLADASAAKPLLERHPEYHELAGRALNLYKQITDKALENEQRSQSPGGSERRFTRAMAQRVGSARASPPLPDSRAAVP